MPRLGSLLLASVLLGIPRALEARAFGAERSVCVDVAPGAPELEAFGAALERALGAFSWSRAPSLSQATVVIDVLSVAGAPATRGRREQAVTLAVRDERGLRRMVLQVGPGSPDAAAVRLLERLEMHRRGSQQTH